MTGAAVRAEQDIVLEVRDLRTDFLSRGGIVEAVRGISLQVRRLERVGIVGESGSGKSALALSILGLIEPPGRIRSGEVLLRGRDLLKMGERELARVRGSDLSMVFQDPLTALDPIRTVGDQLVEAVRLHQDVTKRTAWRQAAELLAQVEVPNAASRLADYPHQYSGGMRQRVMLAMALANEPAVLIADEPTTALDVTTQAQILDLLERLAAERGTAIVLITHNLGIVAEFCRTVLVMYAGRLVEKGSVEEIFDHPVHPYTEALLRSIPRLDRSREEPLLTIPGAPPDLSDLPRGCSFEPRCPRGRGEDVCRQKPPVPYRWGEEGRFSECHFADALAQDGSMALQSTPRSTR
jgi:oligopeptide/dipeptide ABC transporter ATP-binding protein